MASWVLPVGLGVILPLSALIDAIRIPTHTFARSGRSKTVTILWLILVPVLAAADYWISARWLIARSVDDAGSDALATGARRQWRWMLLRSLLAAVAVALLWPAKNGMDLGSVLILTAVMVVPIFACVAVIDVGGALLADERARNKRAAAAH